LHTEVLPFSNKAPTCTRRWQYDTIAIFQVVVMNPPSFGGGNGPNIGLGFSAMDSGKCTVPNCQQNFLNQGFFVGGQTQKGNCRAAYGDMAGSAFWYSFPAEGQCARPDGSKRCTYTARYVGKVKIDDLVNSKKKQIVPNYRDWCMAGGVEFKAESTGCPGSCRVQNSLEFWKSPCDPAVCQDRANLLTNAGKNGLINYTVPNGCDGSTLKTFKYNGQCVRDCPDNTYVDWNYNCVACDPNLHCATCNWATQPPSATSGQGGTRCLTCEAGYPVLGADGRCAKASPQALGETDTVGTSSSTGTWATFFTIIAVLLFIGGAVYWRARVHRKEKLLDAQVHEMAQYDQM